MVKVDYSQSNYCRGCHICYPKDAIYCDVYRGRVSSKPRSAYCIDKLWRSHLQVLIDDSH